MLLLLLVLLLVEKLGITETLLQFIIAHVMKNGLNSRVVNILYLSVHR